MQVVSQPKATEIAMKAVDQPEIVEEREYITLLPSPFLDLFSINMEPRKNTLLMPGYMPEEEQPGHA